MRNMEIIRITSSMTQGTRGVMLIDRQPQCLTLELPWRMNVPFESCIPEGEYLCERYMSARYKETYIVLGVYSRDAILFHPGNFLEDTDGCIIPGSSFGAPNARPLVVSSRYAFNQMMDRLRGRDEFHLTIRNAF